MGTRFNIQKSLIIVIAGGFFGACGGIAPGAGPSDPVIPIPDDKPVEFCSGDATKFEWMGGLISPVPMTSSRLAPSGSSDGAVLRYHVEHDTGKRPSIVFRRNNASVIAGEYDLGSRTSGLDVTLYAGATPVNAVFTGTARFDVNRSQPGPVVTRVCASVYAPNSPFDGARFYVPNFPVMPWSWDDRLAIKLLANHSMNAEEALSVPFVDLVSDPNPLVHVSNYASYEAGAHVAHWDAWEPTALIRTRVGAVGPMGVPFIVEADGVPVYLGAFISTSSPTTSQPFPGPTIDLAKMDSDGFRIELNAPTNQPGHADPRSDARILSVLREAGKLLP